VAGSARSVSNPAQAGQPSLKVPREDNRYLCWPPATQSAKWLKSNREILEDSNSSRLPKWFSRIRSLARVQALAASQRYLSHYAPSLSESIGSIDTSQVQIVVGGHQPELFHPGVWFKNYLLAEIGVRAGAVSLQVIIDHDVAKSDTLRIPSCTFSDVPGTHQEFFQRSVLLPIRGESQTRSPWHLTSTAASNPSAWAETIDRIGKLLSPCKIDEPMLASQSKLLIDSIATSINIGDAFARFRHRIELEHGVKNIEVPMSDLCTGTAFGLFVQHCARNAGTLWSSYNRSRSAFRKQHKIRNQAQPVLELLRTDLWLELPFWIYRSTEDATIVRKRLWISSREERMLLCDAADPSQRTIEIELPNDVEALPDAWRTIAESGICIRPRALMTTLYLRCFIADLFVHGIGGGTYDAVTDSIIREWIGIEPPVYMISSASLHLPLRSVETSHPSDDTEAIRSPVSARLASVQRELQWLRSVPEKYLDRSIADQRILMDDHARLISAIPARGNKRAWHGRITDLRKQIHAVVLPVQSAKQEELHQIRKEIQQTKIRKSREYSLVLFGERNVVSRLQELAHQAFESHADAGK